MLKELRARHPRVELRFWVDVKFAPQAKSILHTFDEHLRVDTIASGKFRRYHHLTVVQHLLWPSLVARNLADALKVLGGVLQSIGKLVLWRPDIIFMKGGYVCLPVGVAAHLLRIPFVIHDSDAHPGLTNRVLSRWAKRIGTGAPLDYYPYPKGRAAYVGIPISEAFTPFTKSQQRDAKRQWGVDPERPLLVVTGGGLGAKRLNDTVLIAAHKLQQIVSVVLVAGAGQYDELRALHPTDTSSFQIYPFITNMPSLLGAADIVATRAGATTILELAALAKPTILIPNAALTGGHQLKNAAVYGEAQAVMVLDESEMSDAPDTLVKAVRHFLADPRTTAAMTKRFAQFAKPNAAKDMAAMILAARRSVK